MAAPRIPLFDLQVGEPEIEAVEAALRSGWLTMGPRTEEFEREFAGHLGVKHAVALSSGTAALHLCFLAAGVGPGDEVIVPAITFVATANAVRYCGGMPVLADILGDHDLSLDPAEVAALVTPRTRAVCVVHYAGYAGPVEELRSLCAELGLALVEDCAHSPSATPPGRSRKLGTFGLASAFSFFSNKVLSCGEGGLLATDDDAVAERARSLRSHAMTTGTWDRHRGHAISYDVVGLGFNYRIDEPRAALLSARLPRLRRDVAERRRLAHRYRAALRELDGLVVPYSDEQVHSSSCYVMPLVLEEPELQGPLRALMLERHGVQTSLLYPAIHEFTAYAGSAVRALPRSERAARTELTLPLYPGLTDDQQDRVVEAVRDGLAELRSAPGSPT